MTDKSKTIMSEQFSYSLKTLRENRLSLTPDEEAIILNMASRFQSQMFY
jgi:hypothetical protein